MICILQRAFDLRSTCKAGSQFVDCSEKWKTFIHASLRSDEQKSIPKLGPIRPTVSLLKKKMAECRFVFIFHRIASQIVNQSTNYCISNDIFMRHVARHIYILPFFWEPQSSYHAILAVAYDELVHLYYM